METPRRFIRFVVPVVDDETHCATGVFQVRWACRLAHRAPVVDRRTRLAFEWFGDFLPVPHAVKTHRDALSWFRREPDRPSRPGAQEPLRRAFLLVGYLRASGIPVETLQTTSPGRVVYEDRWQIVAVPGPETPCGRRA